MMTAGPTLRQTAWHEAGHAVVAWDQGFTVTLVSIRPEGGSLGRSQHTPMGDCAIPSERQRENIVAMAGWAAELQSGEAGDATVLVVGRIGGYRSSTLPLASAR
jgi:ATP-dependent Zn protease